MWFRYRAFSGIAPRAVWKPHLRIVNQLLNREWIMPKWVIDYEFNTPSQSFVAQQDLMWLTNQLSMPEWAQLSMKIGRWFTLINAEIIRANPFPPRHPCSIFRLDEWKRLGSADATQKYSATFRATARSYSKCQPHEIPKSQKNESVLTFEELKQVNHDNFRRGIVGSYRDEMPSELQALFWTQSDNAEAMKRLGFGQ